VWLCYYYWLVVMVLLHEGEDELVQLLLREHGEMG
jgi:hypothetical protein